MILTPEEDQALRQELAPYHAPQNAFLSQVAQMPQEQAIKVLRLAHAADIDLETASRYPNATVQNLIGARDFEDVGKIAPKTYSFLSEPLHMAVVRSKRNVMDLTDIEDSWVSWQDVKEGTKGVIRAAAGFGKGTTDFMLELRKNADATFAVTHTPEEVEARRTEFGREILPDASKIFGGVADYLKPPSPKEYAKPLQTYTHALVQQAPQLAAQIAMALASGGTSAMLFMGSQIAGSDYLDLTDNSDPKKPPVDNARAFGAALADAAMQAPLERLSLGKMLKRLPKDAAKGVVAKEIIESGLTEGLTEWIQKYPESLAEIWARNPDYNEQQVATAFAANFWETTKEGLFEGAVAAPFGFLGGIGKVKLMKRLVEADIQNDTERQERLAQIPMLQSNPELVERWLDNVNGGAKKYVDAKALVMLYQSDIAPVDEISEMLGISQEQVEKAAKQGQFVEVSQAKYDVAGAQNPAIREALQHDMTDDIDGLTLRQISERNVRDLNKAGEKVEQQRDEVKAAADEVMQRWVASDAISQQDAKTAMTALISHARIYSSNPAQFIREKAPLFMKGAASPAGAFQQFAGPKAKTANLDSLQRAKDMDALGEDNMVIRDDTGWFKGMDGKWRFEIDDSKATLNAKQLFTAAEKKAHEPSNSLDSRAFDNYEPVYLADVLNHPDLFTAYPQLKEATVEIHTGIKERGHYDPVSNKIVLNYEIAAEGLNDNKPTTLLHEIQHAIQKTEGFARGGSPNEMAAKEEKRKELIRVHEENLKLWRKDIGSTQKLQELVQQYQRGEIKAEDVPQLLSDWEDNSTVGEQIRLIKDELKQLADEYQGNPFDQYQRLAGEIEARDTARRASLSPEERDAFWPDLRDDAIVIWGGKEYAHQQEIPTEENITNGLAAIQLVIETKSDVSNAMYRPETGWIEFVWGQEGTADKDYENGFGIAKIVTKHGIDDLNRIPEVIAKGNAELSKTRDRIYFTLGDILAVVRLTWDGKERVWLLTGFTKGQNKKPPVSPEDVGPSGSTLSERSFTEGAEASRKSSGAIGEGYGSTDATLSGPMRTRPEEGADASLDINIPQPGELFQSQNNAPKGSIYWNEEGRAIITMFQNADASTVIHEMVGHYFIQNLLDEGAKDTAPDWMKADRQKALDWAASQDVINELTKLITSAERQNNQEAAAQFRDALAFVQAGGNTIEAATDSNNTHHQALRTAYHELLARAAEAYIMEGKAPSAETRSLFRRFTEWLTEIYQDIKALGVTLSPEIRGVFDRMLATETEINRMTETEGYLQKLPDNIYNKLTDKQKAELDNMLANVEEKAKEQVRAHLMLYYTADNQFRIKEEEEAALERITAEVKAMPRYQAEAAIEETFGKKAKAVAQAYVGHQASPFGATSAAEKIATLRVLKEQMVKSGDEAGVANLQAQIDALVQKEAAKKDNELQAAQQMEFEFIATMHGFTSGDHLAQELIAYNDSETSIRNKLEDHMTAFKEQLTDEEALHKNIEEAIYSDDGALLIAAEQQIIDEKLGKLMDQTNARLEALRLREVARQSAAREVAALSLDKVMNLRVWISAERRAAESAQKALAKGDLQAAREQKAIQLFNHQMVQESLKARREFDRITKFLKRQKKSGRDTWMSDELSADGTRSVTDIHFVQGADLLRRLGFGRGDFTAEENFETLERYATKMAEKNPDMVNLPEWLTGRKEDKINLRSLRLDQLKDVEGALRNIKKMAAEGRDVNRFSVLSGNTVEELAVKLIDTAAPLPDELVDKIEKEEVSGTEKFAAGLQRPDQNFLKLDGMKEDGPWTKAFYGALSAAQNAKSKLQRQIYEAIDAAYTAAGVDKEERQRNAHRLIYIPEWGQSVRKNTLLAMLLNMGSQSNKERLFQSRPVGLDINHEADWNEPALKAVLTKYLEPRDFKLAQGIWDAINLLYEPYNSMVRMMTGRPLEKVEALPLTFTLPDGTTTYLSGGYYPLKQDTRATMQAELNFEKSTMETYVGVMPYANAGAAKSRVQGAKYAVDFDIDNLWRHITDVTHDISFRPVMHDINKLLRHDGVRETLRQKLGEANYKVILDWYKAIATAKDATVDNILNSFMSFARTATTIKNLLFRPMTLVQNLANFALYGNAVRGFSERDALESYFQYGWGEYIPHALSNSAKAKEIRAWVYEKSPMMRDKMESPDYTVRDIKEAGYDNRLMKSSNEAVFKAGMAVSLTQEKVIEFGSQMLAWMDQLTDIPMFKGAYQKAIAQGKTEQEAIRFAEAVIIRTTGSGRKIDTSQMQRGTTAEKVFTMFLTFLNTQCNRWIMEGRIFLSERDYWRLIKFVGIKFLAFGMLSAALTGKLPDTDDEDGWKKWFFSDVLSWPLGMIPVGGPVTKVILDAAIGNRTFGYSMSPVEQNIEETIRLFNTAKRYTEGKATTPELLERGSGVASFFLRYPDQFNDWFWNAYDIMNGNMDPELRDLARRRPRKER